MIRINLLPGGSKGRQAKPQYDVRAQAILGVGVVVVTLAGCWWYCCIGQRAGSEAGGEADEGEASGSAERAGQTSSGL